MFSWKKTILSLMLAVNFLSLAFAQAPPQQNTSTTTSTNSDNTTPTGSAKGVNPLGSYGGSNFDKVNLFNGNVSMSFPLASLTSRGGMSVGVVLSYNSKLWRVEKQETAVGGAKSGSNSITYIPIYDEPDRSIGQLAAGWTIQSGRMRGNQSVEVIKNDFTCTFPNPVRPEPKPKRTLTTFTFTSPDGTEYDFRDAIYDGQPKELVNCEPVSRGKEFISKDGTSATFISDNVVVDSLFGGQITAPNGPNGFVYLRDGSRFRIEDGLVRQHRDHNGNIVRYDYDGSRLILVTDNMGRTITVEYSLGNGILAKITVLGIGATPRVTIVRGAKLGSQLPANQVKNIDELFPVEEVQLSLPNFKFNPRTITEITLPDGHKWEFKYNSYGEIVQVKTPARGLVEFEMGPDANSAQKGGYIANLHEIFRRVVNRKTYPSDTGPVEGKVTYSDPRDTSKIDSNQDLTVLQEEVDPNNNDARLALSSHKFSGHPTLNLKSPPFAYRPWREGKELETEQFNFDGSTVMRRSVTVYQQQAGVTWIPGATADTLTQPENNPRVIRNTNRLLDGVTPKVSKVDYEYDGFNNVTREVLTGYNNEIIRQVERTYVSTLNGIDYTSLNVQLGADLDTHLRSLIASETIKDSQNNTENTSVYEYDKYTGLNNAALVPRTLSINTHAQAYQSANRIHRGNVTSVTAGFGTPAETTVYSNYDVLGNVVAVVGPLPNQKSTTEYSAQSHFTFPVSSTQQVRGGLSGDRNLTSSRTFDFSTGAVLSSTGFNNDTTTFTYNDQLDRLTLEVRPGDTQAGGFGRTEYTYSVPGAYPNTVTVQTSLDNQGSLRKLTSVSEFDGFLRTTKQTRTDGENDSAPKVFSETFYDALGRVNKVTNPFREGQSAPTDGYTTSQYDALSRVFRIQTFANDNTLTGTVNTVYDTNQVTVTDQALKQRKSESDAAGRLIKVYEPNPTNQALDQITSYTYDARGNLKQVNQGAQTRTFDYDSLSRLTKATSPESGADGDATVNGETTYTYDKASNLIERKDPRNIITSYSYDSLNRLATKSYSDTTPAVSYFYDVVPSTLPTGAIAPTNFGFQNLLGRTTAVASPTTTRESATGLFHTYDIGGRITKSSQLLDGQHYTTTSDYNLASLPTGHIYPSGRTIAHSYNIAGQITSVTSNNDIISQLAAYTPSGAIKSHQLGNGLFHQMEYNSRLQPTQITLGSGLTGLASEDKWKQEYNYGVYDAQILSNTTTVPTISTNQSQNNGNIGHIKLTPGSGTNPINQFFAYDELNRLKVAKEFATPFTCDFPLTFVSQSGNATIDNGNINFSSNGQEQAQGDVTYTVDLTNVSSGQKIHLVANTILSATGTGEGGYVVVSLLDSNSGTLYGASLTSQDVNPLSLNRTFSVPLVPGIVNTLVFHFESLANPVSTGNLPIYSSLIPIPSLKIVCGQSPPVLDVFNDRDECDGSGIHQVTVTDPDDPINGIINITVSLRKTGIETPILIGNIPSVITGTGSFSFSVLGCANIGISATKANGLTSDSGFSNFSRKHPRLDTSEPNPLVEPTVSWSQEYTYDRYGNRLSVAGTNAQTLQIATLKNRLSTQQGYKYDPAGNLIKDPSGNGKWLFYDSENRLVKVATNEEGTNIIAEYFYDANGWRIKKVVTSPNPSTTRFVYDQGGRLLAEYEGEPVPSLNAPTKENIYAPSGMLATVEPDKINYHTPDHLGSPRVLTDAFGSVISRRDFLPFGNQITDSFGNRTSIQGYSITDSIRQKFTGYQRDEESGLDFAQARYFGSMFGRFVSPDRFSGSGIATDPQSWNRYTYVLNNPLNLIDPTGLVTEDPYSTPELYNQPSNDSIVETEDVVLREEVTAPHLTFLERFFRAVGDFGVDLQERPELYNPELQGFAGPSAAFARSAATALVRSQISSKIITQNTSGAGLEATRETLEITGHTLLSSPVATKAYSQAQKQGVDIILDFGPPPPNKAGEFFYSAPGIKSEARIYMRNISSPEEAVSTIVHETYHISRQFKGIRNSQYQEYRSFVREELFLNKGARPSFERRREIIDMVKSNYPELSSGKLNRLKF